jgi:predicted RNase H-like HicB family nuclease
MNYQGYAARIDYSDEDGLFVGHIAGIKDVVGFHGESISELRAAFEEAVTDYLETCVKLGRAPPEALFWKSQSSSRPRAPCNSCRKSTACPQEHQPVGGRRS